MIAGLLVLALSARFTTPAWVEWTEFRRYLVPGRTLDSLYHGRVNRSSCTAASWQRGALKGYDCPFPDVTTGKDYLYESRWCSTSSCTAWGAKERMWCGPAVGRTVSGAQGCPCTLFAAEPGCAP